MRAFTPRGLPRGNNQAIACNQVPPVNRGTPRTGTELRRTPGYQGGALPGDLGLRLTPNYTGGALPGELGIRQCPVTEGN